jgi:1,2-diacylglycerol 3-alpha-glucosyltransferase
MKIGVFTNNYLPNPYGVANSIESFRKKLEAWGHPVFIFAPAWKNYQDENSKVFRYPSISTNFKFKFPLSLGYSRKIDSLLAKIELDIIHSQHPNLLGTAALKWAKKKKIPLVFTWHTLYDRYTNFVPFLPSVWVSRWTIKNAVKYANRADLVIAPTESIIEILRNWGVKSSIMAVASGVEEALFQNPQREETREKLNIKKEELLIILVSRLTEEKNADFIFRALKDLLKKNNQVKFLVVGDGYLLPELKTLAEKKRLAEKIIFSGLIKKEELKNYLAAGDIYVGASQSETQGMNLSEAMYMGLPVVAVSATGTNSLVKNGENGILVPENEKEFEKAVEKLIEDKTLREKMSIASAKIARENFTDEICARKMLETYQSLLNK